MGRFFFWCDLRAIRFSVTLAYTSSKKMKENGGDANLMWLLDFKVDKLFQQQDAVAQTEAQERISEESTELVSVTTMAEIQPSEQHREQELLQIQNTVEPEVEVQPQLVSTSGSIPNFDPMNPEHAFTVDLEAVDNVANFEQVESQSIALDSMDLDKRSESSVNPSQEYIPPEITFDEQGKPRCTYTDLIERALTESGGLTVSEIYQWIS
jgi:hypothetical protein